jgi:Ca2+-binding EF-hand superfamily protein
MKKWIVLVAVLMMVSSVQAKKAKAKPLSLDQYIAAQTKVLEKAGKTVDEAALEAAFTAKDKDGDGTLSVAEQATKKKKK